jgi:hypothetical protein
VIALSFSFSIGFFLFFHLWLVATNKTTLEFNNFIAEKFKSGFGESVFNEFDVGVFENFKQIFGEGPVWLYFFPRFFYYLIVKDGIDYL